MMIRKITIKDYMLLFQIPKRTAERWHSKDRKLIGGVYLNPRHIIKLHALIEADFDILVP
jgi:hypothetical protein